MEAPSLPAGFELIAVESLDSTNEEARRRAEAGAPDGTVVWAEEQTAGRGRRGRAWTSAPGNLYCSIVLRPSDPPARAMQVGFVAGLAVADAVAAFLPRATFVTCKWPNDVLVEGRKVCGVLLESATEPGGGLAWVVVGAGVNVAHHPDVADGAIPATSLAAEGAEGTTPAQVLESYCARFQGWYVTWRRLGFAAVRQAWLRRAHGLGRPITVRLEDETLEGVFADLDPDGALVLDCQGRSRLVTAGDVFPMGL